MQDANETISIKIKNFAEKKRSSFRKNANIVFELVLKSIKVQYRNSVIGALWTVLNPLLNMIVMYLVFSFVLGYGDSPTYPLYIFCGNILFSLLRASTTQSLTSIVNNRGILTKNKVSQFVFPVSHNISAIVNFGFSSIALLGVMAVVSISSGVNYFTPRLFLVLLMLPAMFLFSYGISLILASAYVFFRDIQHFYNVFLTLWTYMTPVFWKIQLFEDKEITGTGLFSEILRFLKPILLAIIKGNPMTQFIDYFRYIVYSFKIPVEQGGITFAQSFSSLGILYLIGLAFFGVGTLVFYLTRRKFIYYI